MIYQIYKPTEKLRQYIHFYWIMEFENTPKFGMDCQRVIPNGFVEIMFHYGDKLKTVKNDVVDNQPLTVISGQKTDFFDILQTGKTGFVAVLLKPHAAKMFFDVPIQELTNKSIDIESLIKREANNILEQIAEKKLNSQKIEIIENFLLKKLNNKHLLNFKRISESVNLITNNCGLVKVSDLANSACWSEKQFYRVFLDFVGISPKQFLKIVRLQNALYQIQNNFAHNLTDLAYICGYFDQAHFVNDFKALTGFTPKKCMEQNDIFSDYFAKV